MNKDYLTSPFNDDNFKNTFELLKSIREMTESTVNVLKPTFDTVNSLPIKDIANMVNQNTLEISAAFPKLDYIKEISQEISVLFHDNNIMLAQQVSDNFSSLIKSNLPNMKHINSYLSSVSYELFSKDIFIDAYENVENNSFTSNSETKENIITEPDKIRTLQYAFFEFIISCKLFKESLNNKISYSFDRLLSNYGFSTGLSSLVVLIKPNDPLFPIVTFLIVGIVQEIFKEK